MFVSLLFVGGVCTAGAFSQSTIACCFLVLEAYSSFTRVLPLNMAGPPPLGAHKNFTPATAGSSVHSPTFELCFTLRFTVAEVFQWNLSFYARVRGMFTLSPLYFMPGVLLFMRCLEIHMATLRVFYDKWVASAVLEDDQYSDDRVVEEK